jgi:hypothetical protein
MAAGRSLTADEQRAAFKSIAAWRAAPADPVACPHCAAPGLRIEDRSARPHAEWYVLDCPTCGLAATLHMPLAAPGFQAE